MTTFRCAALLTCLASALASAGPLDEEPNKGPEPVDAHLTFAKPWFMLKGKKVQWAAVGIDGRNLTTCSSAERVKSETCGQAVTVDPGAHVIHFSVTSEEDNFRGDATTFYDRLTLGVREDVELDMAKALTGDSAEKAALRKTRPGKSPVPCLAMVETAAYAPACTAADLKAAASTLEKAWQVCAQQETWTDEQKNTLRWLLSTASSNWFEANIASCYHGSVLQKVGGAIKSYQASSLFPAGVVKTGSWRWARSGFDAEAAEGKSLKVHAELLGAAASTAVDKVAMIEAFIEAASNKNFTPLRDAVMKAAFTLDPTTLEGHRLWLLAGSHENDSVFSEWLAKQVKADKSVHCGLYEEQELLVKALLYPKLTRAAYEAIVAMAERTPPTQSLNRCTHIGGANIESDVPALERLTWLVKFDCSAKRAPDKRGDSVDTYFRGQSVTNLASIADQAKLKPIFDKCKAK